MSLHKDTLTNQNILLPGITELEKASIISEQQVVPIIQPISPADEKETPTLSTFSSGIFAHYLKSEPSSSSIASTGSSKNLILPSMDSARKSQRTLFAPMITSTHSQARLYDGDKTRESSFRSSNPLKETQEQKTKALDGQTALNPVIQPTRVQQLQNTRKRHGSFSGIVNFERIIQASAQSSLEINR